MMPMAKGIEWCKNQYIYIYFPVILANIQRVLSGITKEKYILQGILEMETLAGVGIPISKMSCEFWHAIRVLPNTLGKLSLWGFYIRRKVTFSLGAMLVWPTLQFPFYPQFECSHNKVSQIGYSVSEVGRF